MPTSFALSLSLARCLPLYVVLVCSFLDNIICSTPARFLFRELGIRCLGDHFDFTAAAVDLIPTAPDDADTKM